MGITEVSIGETYDDNTTFSKEDKREDFITKLRLGIGAKYEGKKRTFDLTGNITQQLFARNSNFNNITQDIIFNFKNEFSKRHRLSLNNVFTHFEAPSSEDEGYFSQQFGRTTGRFEYFRNRFNIQYSNDVTKQVSFAVKYANEANKFSGTDRPNSLLNKPGFSLSYSYHPTATIFSFLYDFTIVQFEKENDATIHTIGPGIRQYITKKLFLDVNTGVDIIDSFDDENLTEPFVRSQLTYVKDERTRAMLLFSKKYETNPYFAQIFNNWRVSASLTRRMLRRLGGNLSFFYGEGTFIATDTERRLWGANTTVKYDISRNLIGTLTYTYSQSDSDSGAREYSKNTVFLGLAAGF